MSYFSFKLNNGTKIDFFYKISSLTVMITRYPEKHHLVR